jgi:hypothetical protein
MHPAAVLSLGATRDFAICREDIEAFLNMIPWQVARLEVKLWTSSGPPLVTRRWELQGNLQEVITEAARFIVDYPFETGATLLVRGLDTAQRDRRLRFKPLLRKR